MAGTLGRRRSWLRGIALAAIAGCANGDRNAGLTGLTVTGPTLSAIDVTLSTSSLQVGQSATATATGVDQNGAAIATGKVTWTSTAPSIASVDSTGTVAAQSPGTASIVATVGAVSGRTTLTVTSLLFAGATALTLSAPGQSMAYLDAPNPNVALGVDSSSQYLIAVVNTDPTYTSHEDFLLAGNMSGATANLVPLSAPSAAVAASAAPTRSIALAGSVPSAALTAAERTQNHLGVLEENRQIFSTFGNPRALWAAATANQGRSAPISAAIVQSVGTVNKVYVKSSLSGSCTAVDSIGARTVAVGQHVIVLADTNTRTWPQAYRPDSSFYQTFADEFDQITWPHILTYVGDPLAYDNSLSGVGKITVTITPVLNNFAGGKGGGSIVAFVNGCDFYPFAARGSNADLSNQTEMFYSWTPSSTGDDVISWGKELRATAAHETKHIVSYADRIINNSPASEEVWLEEGLAQESSEIWERNFNEATWKGHATFSQTVACELDLGASQPCDSQNDRPIALETSHLPFFFQYLQSESVSHSEGLGLDTPANYGAGWAISRWATDQYATTEGAFIKSLVDEPRLTGLANLSQHTGQSSTLLLTYWNLASAIFQTPTYTIADVRATIPSFDFANIFKAGQAGLTCGGLPCGLFTSSGSPTYPVQPIALTTGTFSRTATGIPGTSAVYYLLTAPAAGTETLELLNTAGNALATSSGLRVAILRVK